MYAPNEIRSLARARRPFASGGTFVSRDNGVSNSIFAMTNGEANYDDMIFVAEETVVGHFINHKDGVTWYVDATGAVAVIAMLTRFDVEKSESLNADDYQKKYFAAFRGNGECVGVYTATTHQSDEFVADIADAIERAMNPKSKPKEDNVEARALLFKHPLDVRDLCFGAYADVASMNYRHNVSSYENGGMYAALNEGNYNTADVRDVAAILSSHYSSKDDNELNISDTVTFSFGDNFAVDVDITNDDDVLKAKLTATKDGDDFGSYFVRKDAGRTHAFETIARYILRLQNMC